MKTKREFINRCHKRLNCPVCEMELIRLEPFIKGKYEFWCSKCEIDFEIYDNDTYEDDDNEE